MNKLLKEIESIYWKIAKIVSTIFLIVNYPLWTEPFSFIRAVLLLVGIAIGCFASINLLDMCVGLFVGIIKIIVRKVKERRVLKTFLGQNIPEDKADEFE